MTLKRSFISRLFTALLVFSLLVPAGVSTVSCQKEPITENTDDNGDKPGDKPGEDFPVVDNPDGIKDPEEIPAGFSYLPEILNADKACVFYYKATGKDALVGYTGDVYVYTGAVFDGDSEWEYVPAKWGVNTDKCKAVKLAANTWKFIVSPSVREWYGTGTQGLDQLGFVFRSSDGKKQTKPDFLADVVDEKYEYDTFEPADVVEEPVPSGAKLGINYVDNGVILVFYDKDKNGGHSEYCHVVGDFSLDENGKWTRMNKYAMKRDDDEGCWWIKLGRENIDEFDIKKEYRFEYFLIRDGKTIKVGDPYTEIVYDQWNDKYIAEVPEFPAGAKGLISAFQVSRPAYDWKNDSFKIKNKNNLVIYELLLRDFTASGDISGAMGQLDYLENLGVTAIELMPIQEFDGNESWGYNPNHYFALDKAYGTREQYKEFIDECHGRGMAVIVDVVYNHATGSHPWAKLYWNGADNCTADYNPWFNVTATHPFSVFHDWNHENTMVRNHIKESLEYLLTEYHVDGFRFDLTKGFTQKNSGNNNECSAYDESRIKILRDYYEHIQNVNPNAIVILEHFCVPSEEKVLSEMGAFPWNNKNYAYSNLVHGNPDSSISGAYANGYVSFMESHDEQRVCYGATGTGSVSATDWGICGTLTGWGDKKEENYKEDIKMTQSGAFYVSKSVEFAANDEFKIRESNSWEEGKGNFGAFETNKTLTVGQGYKLKSGLDSKNLVVAQAGKYDIYFSPSLSTVWLMEVGAKAPEELNPLAETMRRAGCAAAFFLTLPGPKMIWQFGELGYDISGGNGDTSKKPVKTQEFMADKYRKGLYDTYSGLLKFRKEYSEFFEENAEFRLYLNDCWQIFGALNGKHFYVIGNVQNETKTLTGLMPASGSWTDYFSKQTYNTVPSGSENCLTFTLKPGEFKLIVKN